MGFRSIQMMPIRPEPRCITSQRPVVCRKWSRGCWLRLGQLPQSPLLPALYVVSAVDLIRGKGVADVHAEPRLRPFVDRPRTNDRRPNPSGAERI
ncbi:MAG: hypothetical protein U0787_06620 [Polyangia bacterium]